MDSHFIRLQGARQNNLKNLNLELPLNEIICITGPSGSGKSSLAFDTLYAEGYRRYVESLSTYARQFFEKLPKPELDSIENICPAIAIQQTNPVRNSRSTVGTTTEIYDYLRLLFAKLGQSYCPQCGKLIRADTAQSASDQILASLEGGSDRAYLGFFSKEEAKADQFIERGFLRRLSSISSPEIVELESDRGKTLKKRSLIVLDRLVISSTDRPRLVESFESAFREGDGEVFVYLLSTKNLMRFSSDFRCATCDVTTPKPSPLLFSFNSPLGACPNCKGFGNTLEYDEKLVIPNPKLPLNKGALEPFTKMIAKNAQKRILELAEAEGISPSDPYCDLSDSEKKILWNGVPKSKTSKAKPGILGEFKKLEEKRYKLHVRVFLRRYQSAFLCRVCNGSRLKEGSLTVKVRGKTIFDLTSLPLQDLYDWFRKIEWSKAEATINKEILRQIEGRLHFLNRMGVGYLNLGRLARTLSGGETQRITLATQLGAELSGTLYVLDEPSIGLHPQDRDRLLQSLDDLLAMGNSIVVVEHDLDTIKHAHTVLELGPQSGRLGGELVFLGSQSDFQNSSTMTAKYLRGESSIPIPETKRGGSSHFLVIQGASENNLKDVTLRIPLNRFVGVCGVSGSGKSTLIHQTLFNALSRLFHQSTEPIGRFKKLFGADRISDVVLIDQSPLGKSSRSIPLSQIGGYDEVRDLFAKTLRAESLGLKPRDFSFNVQGGRCETCQGEGVVRAEMYFLDDLFLPCEACDGKRFKPEVLSVKYKGKNIHEIFQTTVSDARVHFTDSNGLRQRFEILERVGLGYLQLGQPSYTLSGGEAQRLKIASELLDRRKKRILYIFDEPTTGLHISEVGLLIDVLQDLVNLGNTVIVIEHNLDVLKSTDWIIELGPGAGERGGLIVAEGPPEQLAKGSTATAPFLRKVLSPGKTSVSA